MGGSDSRTEYRLTITLDAVRLPVGEDAQQAILNEIGAHVRTHIADQHGIDVVDEAVSVATGYRYAAVPAACPDCGTEFDLESIHLNAANGAFASAVCQNEGCAWSGDAVYRIIDLEGSQSDAFESGVLAGDITPRYHPY